MNNTTVVENQKLQMIVPGNHWQGLRLIGKGEWALLGTTVSPGFDFRDFVLADRKDLLEKYPEYRSEILRFTR